MAVITGIGGHISKGNVGGGGETKIPCVRTWGVSLSAGTQEGVCSATKGARLRVAGNKDWTGQYTGYGSVPDILPGENFEFEGAITGSGASAIGVKGDAVCDTITINWDIEAGAIINHQVSFGADGVLNEGTVTVPEDDSIPDPETAAGMKIEIAHCPYGEAQGSFSEIHEARTATLVLTRPASTYVSSGLARQTRRKKGNLDCTVDLSCYAKDTDGWATFPQPNQVYAVRIYTSDTQYWLIQWLMFSELGGMDVDIEGASLVGASLTSALTGFWNIGGTPTVGVIKKPDGSDVWPV